jgi:hypothetical protein
MDLQTSTAKLPRSTLQKMVVFKPRHHPYRWAGGVAVIKIKRQDVEDI